jgi:hypothetical protein
MSASTIPAALASNPKYKACDTALQGLIVADYHRAALGLDEAGNDEYVSGLDAWTDGLAAMLCENLPEEQYKAWLAAAEPLKADKPALEAAARTALGLAAVEPSKPAAADTEQAGKTLANAAIAAGRQLVLADGCAHRVKAAYLVRDAIRDYIRLFPQGIKTATSIVMGRLQEVAGASYTLPNLVGFASVDQAFGKQTRVLSTAKHRELFQCLEAPNGDWLRDTYVFKAGIETAAKRLVDAEIGLISLSKGRQRTSDETWRRSVKELVTQAASNAAELARAEAAAKLTQAAAKGDSKEATTLRVEAQLALDEAKAMDAKAESHRKALEEAKEREAEKLRRDSMSSADRKAEAEAKAVAKAAEDNAKRTMGEGTGSQAPLPVTRDVALAYITDVAKTGTVTQKAAIAQQLVGVKGAAAFDTAMEVLANTQFTAEQWAEICLFSMRPDAMEHVVKGMNDAKVKAFNTAIRHNPALIAAVAKTYGQKAGTIAMQATIDQQAARIAELEANVRALADAADESNMIDTPLEPATV